MLHIVHNRSELPIITCKPKACIFDLSDSGELGYGYGYNPETLPSTLYDLLFVSNDSGLGFHYKWDSMLNTRHEKLILLNNPIKMCDIHAYVAVDFANGTTMFQQRLQSLVNYMRNKEYKEVWILCGESKHTLLRRAIDQIK